MKNMLTDWIVVMDGGQIAESGSHTELMQCGGMYAEMFKAQSQAYVSKCE